MAVSKLIYYTCHNVLLMLSMCITSFESLILFHAANGRNKTNVVPIGTMCTKVQTFGLIQFYMPILSLASLLLAVIAAHSSDYCSSSERLECQSQNLQCAEQSRLQRGQGLVIIPKFD